MKYIQTVTSFILITFLFSTPSKQDFSDAFIKVADKGNPAVVSIVSEKTIENNFHYFFEPFDGRYPHDKRKGYSLGSGVIIDANKGYIITNYHVIEDAAEIKAILFDRREMRAEIIASDPASDIAVIKVNPDRLTTVDLGNSEELQVGEWVVAIGSPFGLHLNHTVTAGIVSAVGRNNVISQNNFEDFIQHDAAINPGNSGGALFNLDGKLVGINTAIATDGFSRANAGVGFAIPINMVKRIMGDLISDGKVTRGWLGVHIQDLNSNMIKTLGLSNRNGALISQVMKDSPAEDAGVHNKDVVIGVNGEKVENSSQLKNIISSGRPNDKTKLTLIRDGKEKKMTVTLGVRPDQEELADASRYEGYFFDLLGLHVEIYENTDDNSWFSSLGLEGVMVMEIKPNSIAEENNIQQGDVIIEMGKKEIQNVNDYSSELETYNKGDTIMLRILRNNSPLYIAFEID